MSVLERVNNFFLLIVSPFRQFGYWRVWLLLGGFFLLNWLILYAHYDFLSPLFYGIVTAWSSLFGEQAGRMFSHYPQQFALMAELYGWAKLGVGLVLEGLVLGAAVRLFARRYGAGRETGKSLAAAWIHLVIVWGVLNALTVAAGILLPEWLGPLLNGPRRLLVFSFVVLPFVFTVIFSLFFFAIPSVVVYGENAFRAIGRSLRIFSRRPLTCFFLSVVVLFLPLLCSAFGSYPDSIIERFKPELVYWLLLAGLFFEMIANFFWMSMATRFLVDFED